MKHSFHITNKTYNPVFWADPSGGSVSESVFENLGGTKTGSFTDMGTGTSIGAGGAGDNEEDKDEQKKTSDNGDPKNGDPEKSESNTKSTDCSKCWWLNNDEYLTFEEAIWHYRLGKGEPVDIRLNKLDLSNVKSSDFDNHDFMHQGSPGKYVRLSSASSILTGNRSEGLVLGTIEVVYIGDNKVMALPNEYNFEMQGEKTLRGVSRDIATAFGGFYNNGGMRGQSYWIQFLGTATIRP